MFSRTRVAVFVAVAIALSAATIFVVQSLSDLHDAQRGLKQTDARLGQLHTRLHGAAAVHADELDRLAQVRDTLRRDTAALVHLRETDRVEYLRLSAAVDNLARHQSQLAADAARARLLDDCLTGASQVLNQVAVGDTGHLSATLPAAQLLCSQATAA